MPSAVEMSTSDGKSGKIERMEETSIGVLPDAPDDLLEDIMTAVRNL